MYEVEIRNGLDLLDKKLDRGVWLSRVIPAHIEMMSCVNCVAAQATGGTYAQSLVILGLVSADEYAKAEEYPSYPMSDDIAKLEAHYGFEIMRTKGMTATRMLENINALQNEWRATIRAMQFPVSNLTVREAVLSNA